MMPPSLADVLRATATTSPSTVAVVEDARAVTYRELFEAARTVAGALDDVGVSAGDRVAITGRKSIATLAAVHGVLEAGAAYVPIDPTAPMPRRERLLGEAQVAAILLGPDVHHDHHDAAAACRRLQLGAHELYLHRPLTAPTQGHDRSGEGPCDDPVAYILFTSGSTGTPKGVVLTHRNALHFVCWMTETFGVSRGDRIASQAPLQFDLSIFDVFGAASRAATLVLVPDAALRFPPRLAQFLADASVSVWYTVPSTLNMLAARGGLVPSMLPNLRVCAFAGEVLPPTTLRRLTTLLPEVRFANLYGPTETNVCTWFDVPPGPWPEEMPVPIGVAIPGVELAIIDDGGRPLAAGQIGELVVRGPTVADGYFRRPDATGERFGAHVPGQGRSYRTGDFVRAGADGVLEFHGRRDRQVKSRGYRIELDEIEVAARRVPGMVDCVAFSVPDELVGTRVCLAAVFDDEGERLWSVLRDALPAAFQPDHLFLVAALPHTVSGKVDLPALAAWVTGLPSPLPAVVAAAPW